MFTLPRLFAGLSLFVASLHAPLGAVPSTDGLYATFTVSQGGSPLGEFSVELDYTLAPRTVANFVGLAEGTQTWIDPVTYRARTDPYYDGIIFHRVIDGFVIQGGSPQGTGSDGPGYTFTDEFDPALRHDAAGVLSMANSGPNSNGSQFFVTLDATPWLDDVHNVFGTVVEGLDVVQAIGTVPTDNGDKPLTDVVIDSVVITRNGTAAQAFDPSAQTLPRVEGTDAALVPDGTSFDLSYTQQENRQYFTSTTTDLATWSAFETSPFIPVGTGGASTLPLDAVFDTASDPRGFVGHAAVFYSDAFALPPDAVGKQVVLTTTNGIVLTYVITQPEDASVSAFGTAQFNANPASDLLAYFWSQEAYRVRFFADPNSFNPISVTLNFESAGSGTFSGNAFDPTFPISGTFTFGDAP